MRLIIIFYLLFTIHAFAETVKLEVDATEATRRIFHSTMAIPVQAGPLTLYFPKWFPGTHAPTGQISDMVGLRMQVSGKEVAWTRDPVDVFAFHCVVPEGARELNVGFDYVVPTETQKDHHPTAASEHAAMISWTSLALYPSNPAPEDLVYEASLILPDNWKYGTALKTTKQEKNKVAFAPVSFYTLVDSPVVAGSFFQTVDLDPGSQIPYRMHLAADSEDALKMKPEVLASFRKSIRETLALFGARHFEQYNFLVTLSDPIEGGAVEHHESSDNRPPERMFLDQDPYLYWADTLSHEMVHSWNGKYKRPAGLVTRNYQEPIHSELLWVYEGLTQYLGYVIATRSGLLTAQEFRDATAWLAAGQDVRPGRTWKPLVDTSAGVPALIDSSSEWSTWRRARDYYNEGFLIWLAVDMMLREKTRGKSSLDDFCKSFFGGKDTLPAVSPYSLDDIAASLNQIVASDWKEFFESRVNRINQHPPLKGLEMSGWRLVYKDKTTPYDKSAQKMSEQIDLRYSVGLILKEDGKIVDVVPGSAAAKSGIAPGMKIIGINGRKWSETRIKEALRARMEILAENGDFFRTFSVDYHEGEKYPCLEQLPGSGDALSEIIKPKS